MGAFAVFYAKTAEPIEMRFGRANLCGPKEARITDESIRRRKG